MAGRLLPWLHRVGSCQLRVLRVPVAGQVRGLPRLPPSSTSCPQPLSSAHVPSPVCQELSFSRSLHVSAPCFKKGKDRGKDKGGKDKGGGKHVVLTNEELSEVFDVEKLHKEMQAAVEHLRQYYLTQLSLRITAGVLKDLTVATKDGMKKLEQLCEVNQKSSDLIQIKLDRAQDLDLIRKAIQKLQSNLKLQQEGNNYFISVPKMTTQHRDQLLDAVAAKCNRSKDTLKTIYQRYHKNVNSVKSLHSEDLIRNCQASVLDILQTYKHQMEELMRTKQSEIKQEK